MRLHDLKPSPGAKHRKKRVGRGNASGTGKTSGRGQKGQRARNKVPVWFEGGQMPIQRRIPKFGGFTNRNRVEYEVVNLDTLGERFEAGTVVTLELLAEHRLISGVKKRLKVLGRGEVGKALTVRAHKFSGKAAEKIAAAGGKTEAIG